VPAIRASLGRRLVVASTGGGACAPAVHAFCNDALRIG
jgi:hypothetical protein